MRYLVRYQRSAERGEEYGDGDDYEDEVESEEAVITWFDEFCLGDALRDDGWVGGPYHRRDEYFDQCGSGNCVDVYDVMPLE